MSNIPLQFSWNTFSCLPQFSPGGGCLSLLTSINPVSSAFSESTALFQNLSEFGEQEDGEGEILSLSKSRAELGLVLTTLFPAARSSLQEDFCLGLDTDMRPSLKNLSWDV